MSRQSFLLFQSNLLQEAFMATYVLIHGGNLSGEAWNKLAQKDEFPPGERLGGKLWNTILPALTANHHAVFAPTLKDEALFTLSDHIEQI